LQIPDIIKEYLKGQEDILAAYLFGSFAKGKEKRRSDIDIAVLFSSDVKDVSFADRQITIINDLSQLLNKEIDIVALNNASSLLKFKVAQTGKCLYEKNIIESRRFRARSIIEYFDFLPIKNFIESNIIAKIKKV